MTRRTSPRTSLDPENWDYFRVMMHRSVDLIVNHMRGRRNQPVWQNPKPIKQGFHKSLEKKGNISLAVLEKQLSSLLPFGVGNTHGRFWGWVHGAGTHIGIMAELYASAINANCGGRDHGAIYVEREVVRWAAKIVGFPKRSSGVLVSGTSLANLLALVVARRAVDEKYANPVSVDRTRIYVSQEAHSCLEKAARVMGLPPSSIAKVSVDGRGRIEIRELSSQIDADIRTGLVPLAIVGTAGTVNLGAYDDLTGLSKIAKKYGVWFHVDGAFGALTRLSPRYRRLAKGINLADSVAFDFHKWLQVQYDCGILLVRDPILHRHALSLRPPYLKATRAGTSGGEPWPSDFTVDLSRSFRALKVWATIKYFGSKRLGQVVSMNIELAKYLAGAIAKSRAWQLAAPCASNVVCFRPKATASGRLPSCEKIAVQIQESGLAVISTTKIDGKSVLRVAITNHRTTKADIDAFLSHLFKKYV